jgi:hypothetical protein
MPETATLDLTAEDLTQVSWDELVHRMLGPDEAPLELRGSDLPLPCGPGSSPGYCCTTCGGSCSGSCGGGFTMIHG